MCLGRGAVRVSLVALAVFAASIPSALLAEETDTLFGYSTSALTIDPAGWVDPAVLLGLNPDSLAPTPDFDIASLHNSTIFAADIDWIRVEDDELDLFAERHVRVLQVIETVDRDVDDLAIIIKERRPRIAVLNGAIAHEHAEEARLENEISILNKAIAEFAVRAFISEDELETALTLPDSEMSETRVVSDEVRTDQFAQIVEREAELSERRVRRAVLETEVRVLRSELRELRRDRLDLLFDLRTMEDLSEQTAAAYQLELHRRLGSFVEGTDVPLVALNAYVIAERLQATENPTCGVEWWMLAGIGKIESIHGHFGNSTLDINGTTTDSITGPALDGRILEGAEYLVEGVELPEPTDRTGAIEVELPPESIEPPSDAPATGQVSPDGAASDAAPVPVVKRLALIEDSDGGRLDGDSLYDRAVGPMQFIPQTWGRYETDANHDDEMNPQNVYDAALASARYLCNAAGSMTTAEGREQAYFAYNHDKEYSDDVAAAADFYRTRIEISDGRGGSSHELGVANPDLTDVASRAAEASKELNDPSLPDWANPTVPEVSKRDRRHLLP